LQLARAVAQVNPERAVALLEEARRLDASNPETFTQMGSLLLDQRDPYGALQEFDQALRRAPDSPDAHSNRGTALFLLGRLGEAEAEFLEALHLDPCHANARHNLVLLYQTRGEDDRRQEIETPPPACSQTR
jgi:Flp pilus assembly protein TadD